MAKDIYEAIKDRRSNYSISNEKVVPEARVEEIVKFAVKHTPTAFNSQTGRVVILFDEENNRFWNIVEAALKKIVPEESFASTKEKIDGFRSGYGTVLFYEDQAVVEQMQEDFPLYSENFPKWSEQSSGMLQYNVWTLLEAEGLGASLQHYTELIEEDVRAEWDIPKNWRFVAQMPFGKVTAAPDEKEFQPLYKRVKVYK
ncbi:MAG: nitroreductase [Halanaerobium sp. MSAO_Bac5]|nr:MAG: nitroreductase [Halanaerobium sp. MSAO_Bac5]